MDDCIFCRIIEKKLPAVILFEDPQVIVIKDRFPRAPIHYLIIPKKHVKDIGALQGNDYALGAITFAAAQRIAREVEGAEDFNLLVNNGYGAGQRVFHLHTHFLAGRRITDVG
jgi:histidine triad (HIT) family protein